MGFYGLKITDTINIHISAAVQKVTCAGTHVTFVSIVLYPRL